MCVGRGWDGEKGDGRLCHDATLYALWLIGRLEVQMGTTTRMGHPAATPGTGCAHALPVMHPTSRPTQALPTHLELCDPLDEDGRIGDPADLLHGDHSVAQVRGLHKLGLAWPRQMRQQQVCSR